MSYGRENIKEFMREEMKMKRIAIFAPAVFSVGGEQRVVTILANEFARLHDVTIFTNERSFSTNSKKFDSRIKIKSYFPYGKRPSQRILRFVYRQHKTDFFEKHTEWVNYLFYSNNAVSKMIRTVGNNYDVVIAVSEHLSVILGKAKQKGLNCKAIGWEHSSYEAYFETPDIHLWKREKIFIKAAKWLDEIIVLNDDVKNKYWKNMGLSCKVIYNPRSFVSERKSSLENKLFVSCGRFVEVKGFDLLIEAFDRFTQKESEWKLMIIGDGPMRQEIEREVKEKGIEARVIFTGYIDDVQEKMTEGSIYLLSSRWEGFPMCVTEAYEVGLPMISFDIPAVEPLTGHNEGIVVPAFDISAYADAMVYLAENKELREDMAKNAIKMAESISIEKIEKNWETLFDE